MWKTFYFFSRRFYFFCRTFYFFSRRFYFFCRTFYFFSRRFYCFHKELFFFEKVKSLVKFIFDLSINHQSINHGNRNHSRDHFIHLSINQLIIEITEITFFTNQSIKIFTSLRADIFPLKLDICSCLSNIFSRNISRLLIFSSWPGTKLATLQILHYCTDRVVLRLVLRFLLQFIISEVLQELGHSLNNWQENGFDGSGGEQLVAHSERSNKGIDE